MKKNILFTLALLAALFCLPSGLTAQHNLMLYNMDQVPQRLYQNPSFIPEQNVYVGIPVLSGFQISWNSPFAYHDILTRESDDSLRLEPEKMLDKVSRKNLFLLDADIDLLSVGFKVAQERFFINFGIRERSVEHAVVPDDLIYLLWYGNTYPTIFGQTATICPVINMSVYDEWNLTFAGYALDRRLTYGVTAKFLSGHFNIRTKHAQFDLYTDSTTYDLYMKSDFEVQTAGIDDIDESFDNGVNRFIFAGNNGFGLDLGASYRINDKFSANVSLLDLGFIRWRTRSMTLVSDNPGKEFVFDGFSLHSFMNMAENLDEFGQEMTDSIKDLVEIDTVYDQRYTSWLPARINLGGDYRIDEKQSVHLLLNGIAWDRRLYTAMSLAYRFKVKDILELSASYNIYNKQYWNFGAGMSLRAGSTQFYVSSDNLTGWIFTKSTNNLSLQFGINISLVKRDKEAEPSL